MFDNERLSRIQQHALDQLEKSNQIQEPLEPEVNGRWRRLSERKWEFRFNDIVLATIFHKPNDKFSLFCPTPNLYKKVHQVAADTFLFDSFEEASTQFPVILEKLASKWCISVLQYLDS